MFRATESRKATQVSLGCDLSLSQEGRLHFGPYLRTKQSNPAEIGRATVWGRQGRGTVA
jgi:hypothetical protein